MSYDERRPAVAEVRRAVDRRPAQVDADLARLAQSQLAHGARGGVVEVQHGQHPTSRPPPPRQLDRGPSIHVCVGISANRSRSNPDANADRQARCVGSLGGHGEHPGQADARRHRGTLGGRSGTPTAPTASTAPPPATRSSPSTRRRPPSAARCTSATCSATPTPTPSPASSACAARHVFYPMGWDDNGLPTERRVQNYYGVRCDPSCPTSRASSRRSAATRRRTTAPIADLAAELPRAVRRARRDRREGLRGAVAPARPVGRLDAAVRHDRRARRAAPASARSCATSPAARRTARKRRRCGTSTSAPPSPRPRWRTASVRAPTTSSRSTAPTATATIEIDTTRPELLAACVALVAHPDDERYQPLFGTTVRTPLYGVEVPVLAHELAQPDKGTGIAMICTFGDTTDVTWWRELNLPMRAIIGRDGRFARRARRPTSTAAGRTRTIAGLTVKQAQKRRRRAAAGVRRAARRAAPDPAPGEVLRARRAPARDRHHPPVVHPQRRPRRRPARRARRPRRRAHVAPRPHAPPLRELGRGPQRRLARQPPAVLRRADPGLVPRSTPTGEPDLRRAARCPTSRGCRSTRRPTSPSATTDDQRDQPGGFIGDPDVFDTWATSSLTPQIAGCWEEDVRPVRAHLPDGHAPAGPRHHPHLAVLHHGPQPPRVRRRAVGATPRCRAGSSTPTARRCRSRRATSSRRWTCSSSTAPTPCATGRRSGRPGVDTAFERRPDEGRPQARHEAAQRHQVRAAASASPCRRPTPTTAVTDPLDLSMLAKLDAVIAEATDGVRGVRLRPRPRAHRGVLLVVLRRLRRARQGPRLRLAGRRGGRRRPGSRCARRSARVATAVRTDPPVRRRGGRGVGGTTAASTCRRGRCRPRRGGDPDSSIRSSRCSTLVRRAKTEAKQSQRRRGVAASSAHRLDPRRDRTGTCRSRRRGFDHRHRPGRRSFGETVLATTSPDRRSTAPMTVQTGPRTSGSRATVVAALVLVLIGAPVAAEDTTTTSTIESPRRSRPRRSRRRRPPTTPSTSAGHGDRRPRPTDDLGPSPTSTIDDRRSPRRPVVGAQRGPAPRRRPIAGPAAAPGSRRTRLTGAAQPPPPTSTARIRLPANSGSGRRAVYSKTRQRVWAVDENDGR